MESFNRGFIIHVSSKWCIEMTFFYETIYFETCTFRFFNGDVSLSKSHYFLPPFGDSNHLKQIQVKVGTLIPGIPTIHDAVMTQWTRLVAAESCSHSW